MSKKLAVVCATLVACFLLVPGSSLAAKDHSQKPTFKNRLWFGHKILIRMRRLFTAWLMGARFMQVGGIRILIRILPYGASKSAVNQQAI